MNIVNRKQKTSKNKDMEKKNTNIDNVKNENTRVNTDMNKDKANGVLEDKDTFKEKLKTDNKRKSEKIFDKKLAELDATPSEPIKPLEEYELGMPVAKMATPTATADKMKREQAKKQKEAQDDK